MNLETPRLQATLVKGCEVRHVLIEFVDGPGQTRLIQLSGDAEKVLGTGTQYEMEQRAGELIQLWTETDGFRRKKKNHPVYEPLSAAVALAIKMDHTDVFEGSRKIPLYEWQGVAASTGGSYEYALNGMQIHAQFALPANDEPIELSSDPKELAAVFLKNCRASGEPRPLTLLSIKGRLF